MGPEDRDGQSAGKREVWATKPGTFLSLAPGHWPPRGGSLSISSTEGWT